jgi:putative membrane protein insertion efficiency factor
VRLRLAATVAVLAIAVGLDLARPPDRQLSTRLLVGSVHAYQAVGHSIVPRGQCRFSPTCSRYAETVIRRHGALKGGWLTARRLVRCGPWTPAGTVDPPPEAEPSRRR